MKRKVYTEVPLLGKIELVDYYEQFVNYYPKCEMETKKWGVENCKEEWVIFDCGANIGYYSILFAKLASKGFVYAFEPTDTIIKLKKNLEFHQIKNVSLINIALSDKTCTKKDKIYKIWGSEPENTHFNFITIDDFVDRENIRKIDLIKIDVDSYDFEVLKGAKKTLNTLNPFVIVELNHALSLRNTSNYEAIEWMVSQGYDSGLVLDYENILFKKNYSFEKSIKFNLFFNKDEI